MGLGLGSSLSKGGLATPSIVTDSLVLKHNYAAGGVVPVSDGAADINADVAANEYIAVPAITIGTGDISVSAWVFITEFVDYAGIFCNRDSDEDNYGIALRTRSSGTVFDMIIDDSSGSTTLTSTGKNINQWYHLCCVWDRDGSGYLYIDGVLDVSGVITARQLTLSHDGIVKIGQNSSTNEMRGYICNVGYWNGVLTQAQIKSIMWKNYAGLASSETTNLVSWWNLDEQTATDGTAGTGGVKDYHGSNHGTLT